MKIKHFISSFNKKTTFELVRNNKLRILRNKANAVIAILTIYNKKNDPRFKRASDLLLAVETEMKRRMMVF
jgi:hypothetical protein